MIKKDAVKLLSINNLKKISKKIQSFKHISFVWNTLLIISVALIVYLVLPKIFNYQKKESLIVESINKNYGIKLENLSDISYSFFPTPKLILKNSNFTFKKNSLQGKAEEILLKINISDLYSNEEINIKKIHIIKSDLKISTSDFKTFIGNLDLIKDKILIKNSSLDLVGKDKLITLKNLSFENSDKKLFLNANLFDQKIKLIFIKNIEGNRLNLKISEIGLQTNIVFSEQSNMNLSDGISFVLVVMATFAMSEALTIIIKGNDPTKAAQQNVSLGTLNSWYAESFTMLQTLYVLSHYALRNATA